MPTMPNLRHVITAPARTRAEQLEWESYMRQRLAVLAIAGGVLYELSSVTLQALFKGAPTVGLVQGLSAALHGVIDPRVSPRAAEVKFASHHAFGTIAGSFMAAAAVFFAAVSLLFVFQAARSRRPGSFALAGPLAFFGGIAFALLSIVHEIINAITTHQFATGHDFSNTAVDRALSTSPALQITTYIDLVVALAFGVGVVGVCVNATRTGLFTRLMGTVGGVAGVLFVLPLPLNIITAFWMVALGILFLGRWPNGDPPAWAAGEARPWPSNAELRRARESQAAERGAPAGRAARTGRRGRQSSAPLVAGAEQEARSAGAGGELGGDSAQGPPEPTLRGASSANRRKRKRSARR